MNTVLRGTWRLVDQDGRVVADAGVVVNGTVTFTVREAGFATAELCDGDGTPLFNFPARLMSVGDTLSVPVDLPVTLSPN